MPEYAREVIPHAVQAVHLSRTSSNDVLKRHGLNGYKKNYKRWKFFRATRQDELWQADLKRPYSVQGKWYWFFVCIDDYIRYLLVAEHFDHAPTSRELAELLEALPHRPKKILTDNGPQFRDIWKRWCTGHHIEPVFAHPYYPQDKGKVERAIRNREQGVHLFTQEVSSVAQWKNKGLPRMLQ